MMVIILQIKMYLPVMFCVILVAEAAAVRLQTSRDQSSDQNYITGTKNTYLSSL